MIVPTLESEADNANEAEKPSLKTVNDHLQSVGEMLQIARNHHALSIHDVAQKLCLVEDKIMAMEAEQWATLGAAIYARGYVDAYARLVGLPKDIWQPLLHKIDYFKQHAVTTPLSRKPIAIDNRQKTFFRNKKGTPQKAPSGLKKLLVAGTTVFVVALALLFWIGERSNNSGFTQDVSKPMQLQLSNMDQVAATAQTTPVQGAAHG